MLALIQKIDAADAAHFAKLHETAKKQAVARAKALEDKRANLRLVRARWTKATAPLKRKLKS
jgi:hypothetical protein